MNKLSYGTVCGHWGDVLLSIQRFKNEVGEGNIVYLGPFEEVVDFLKAQPFIHEVRHYKEPHFLELLSPVFSDAQQTETKWRDFFNPKQDIPNDKLIATHLTKDIVLWPDPCLSQNSIKWAQKQALKLPKVFFLIQPFSFASNTLKKHWANWYVFLDELINCSPFTFVLAGQDWPEEIKPYSHPRLLNWVNQIPGMQHLYALSNLSTGVITTSNSLAHWNAASKKPTTVICNQQCSSPDYYFRKALESGGEHMNFVNINDHWTTAIDKSRILFPFP